MFKHESKNTSGKLFDSTQSDDDDLRTTSSDTYGLWAVSHTKNIPKHQPQVNKVHDNEEDITLEHSLNIHKDPHALPASLPLEKSETIPDPIPTNFQPPEPVKIEGMVFMKADDMRISTAGTLPNATKDATSSKSGLVSEEPIFMQQRLDQGSSHAMSSKVLNLSSHMSQQAKPKEESGPNLSGEVTQGGNLPIVSLPVAIPFPSIETGGAAEVMNADSLRGCPDHGLAQDFALRPLNSLYMQPQYGDERMSSNVTQPQNDCEAGNSLIGKFTYLTTYIFPRLSASLVDKETRFTFKNPSPNFVETCCALLLRVDPRLSVYYVILLFSAILTLVSLFKPQIIYKFDDCYTFWGYKNVCGHVSYSIPVLLMKSELFKNSLYIGGIFSILALILYLVALMSVWVCIFCINKPSKNMPKIRRWIIGSLGLGAFLMHCISWIIILNLYNRQLHETEAFSVALGSGFDLALFACFVHSVGLALLLFLPYSKISSCRTL